MQDAYLKFKNENADRFARIAKVLSGVPDGVHWELIDDMKGSMGTSAANNAGDCTEDELDDVLSNADEWVSVNCSSGGAVEDVAMAFWLKGSDEAFKFLGLNCCKESEAFELTAIQIKELASLSAIRLIPQCLNLPVPHEAIHVTGWMAVPGAEYCSMRCIAGTDPLQVKNRVAFIEKTPRIRVAPHPGSNIDDGVNWFSGPKGSAPEYGEYQPSRDWCDRELEKLGYILNEAPTESPRQRQGE